MVLSNCKSLGCMSNSLQEDEDEEDDEDEEKKQGIRAQKKNRLTHLITFMTISFLVALYICFGVT